MGFFDFFNSYTQEEKDLIDFYTSKYSQGNTSEEAKRLAKEMIDGCIAKSKAEGMYESRNLGEEYIKNEEKYPRIKEIRKEGVQDIDIQWFWNMSDVARKVTIEEYEMRITTTFMSLLDQRLSREEAAAKLKKSMPTYHLGNPNISDIDSLLPYELKNIVEIYVSTQSQRLGFVGFKDKVDEYSSFNAFIRAMIKAGEFDE